MTAALQYLIGVDGGGSKTLARIARPDGTVLGEGGAGPAGLRNGSGAAWIAVADAIDAAFENAGVEQPGYGRLAAGIGIAGFNVAHWAAAFRAEEPGFGALVIETDAVVTLLGAHGGQAGAIIAIGTGAVGAALYPDGARHVVGGWGFPSGDDASGAWLGLHAINHVQRVLDGRAMPGPLALDTIAFCGGPGGGAIDHASAHAIVLNWLTQANQNQYAQLARLVVEHGGDDPVAHDIMTAAGVEIEAMAQALDPAGKLPLALCGGLAAPLLAYLPEALQRRAALPRDDAAGGALLAIRRHLEHQPTLQSRSKSDG
jgi:glucosamine kinase